MWPILLDYTEEECRKILRRLELEAYGSLVSALRAQGGLTSDKLKLLKETASALHIPPERHRAEVRRAANDEQLCTIAQYSEGTDTFMEWSAEGRRKIRLVPRVIPQTAFLAVARRVADAAQADNAKMPSPAATVRSASRPAPPLTKFEQEERLPAKKRRRSSQDSIPSASYGPPPTKHRIQKHGIAKIHHVYKNQTRVTPRQNQPLASPNSNFRLENSIMPPPRATIKTIPPVKQRTTIVSDAKAKDSPNNEQFKPQHIATTLYSTSTKTVSPVPPSSTKVTPIIKLPQSQNQKLVIVSAAQKTIPTTAIASSLPAANALLNSMNTLKTKPPVTSEDEVPQPKQTKLLTSQVIVSKSQLTPLPINVSEKPKVLTVQAKVRPQGSIIVPLQSPNTTSSNQFAGVSVPVLQGVQWKTIQGKSTVKLLPLTANTKIIQKQIGSITTSLANTVTSGPIYVMNKPGNIIVNKTTTAPSEPNDKNLTHIRPITTQPIKCDDKVLLIRRPSTSNTPNDSSTKTIQETNEESTEERKSNVLQDALLASGVTSSEVDDDIETQISQYAICKTSNSNSTNTNTPSTSICNNLESKTNKNQQKDPEIVAKPIQQIVVNRPIQNIQLQDTKFLTIEEAMELLGDSNETRALLNHLHVENSPVVSDPVSTEEETNASGSLDPQTGIYSTPGSTEQNDKSDDSEKLVENFERVDSCTLEQPSQDIETIDIFSKALASADIHLDQNTTEEYFVEHESEVLTVPRAETEETINEIIIEEATTDLLTETENINR